MASLAGKTALITGAASGMGQAHAVLLAERGARVVLNDINPADETEARIRAEGGDCLQACFDVGDPAAVESGIATASAALGPIDILVNNAGISEHLTLEEIEADNLDRLFAVHIKGAFFCTKAVIPAMKQRRAGKIINVSSIWGMTGHRTASHYCMVKAALLGATKSWAQELAPFNIHVNAIAPGGVLTPMPIKIQGMERIREKEKKIPLGRWARPEEISYSVAFLASSESDFITGQVISQNGGETIVGI